MTPFWILLGFFALIPLVLTALAYYRAHRSRTFWRRTSGEILSFACSHQIPEVTYRYEVNGAPQEGRAIIPGVYRFKEPKVVLPNSLFLHADGSLRFAPGTKLDVFYDPAHPEDAALIPGIGVHPWSMMLACAALLTILSIALTPPLAALLHPVQWAGLAFIFMGAMPLAFWFKFRKRERLTRTFLPVEGELLSAEISRESASHGETRKTAYDIVVHYRYEVGGNLYESRQLRSIWDLRSLLTRREAEERLAELRAQPRLTVHYHPAAPWDAFLWRKSAAMLLAPLFLFLVAEGVGWYLLLYAR